MVILIERFVDMHLDEKFRKKFFSLKSTTPSGRNKTLETSQRPLQNGIGGVRATVARKQPRGYTCLCVDEGVP